MKTHDYEKFAKAYADLEIADSFYLAYRDIPKLLEKYVKGKKALDYGCGGGRSTRFLKKLGFETTGVDISSDMIKESKTRDQNGKYLQIKSGEIPFEDSTFDLIFSAIVFLEIPLKKEIEKVLNEMKRVLKKDGIIVIITGTRESYTDNWASFICDFPENKNLKSGDKAKLQIRGTDVVLYDYVWFDEDYKKAFANTNLRLIEKLNPMPKGNEPYKWYAETRKPHWVIYVLGK
jgi:ubiquinone/menaquinone biosynthesis C-methylase UbiE